MQTENAGGVSNPTILFENDEVAIINKPAGIMVHPDGRSKEPTLLDWIRETFSAIDGVGEPLRLQDGTEIQKPGIVHRLDKDTSGVLVIAKTQPAFVHLKEQFKNRLAKKTYVAFVHGVVKEDEILIERAIGRSASDFRKWSATRGARGVLREATTIVRTLERGSVHTYIEASPKTGRTHQIRVHLKAINHPIVCDKLYAEEQPCTLGFTRHALHSRSIEIQVLCGERVQVDAPLPPDFEHALGLLNKEIA